MSKALRCQKCKCFIAKTPEWIEDTIQELVYDDHEGNMIKHGEITIPGKYEWGCKRCGHVSEFSACDLGAEEWGDPDWLKS
jgi:hypothetical protein